MSLRPFLLAGIAVLVLSSCNQDLDITAPYKENTIVYALLDKDSAIQYVKINKAFLGPDNAFIYAQVPDSTEYQDGQLQAEIQEVKNGVVVNTYVLHDTTWQHDPGTFPTPHKLYYFNTPTGARLDSSATYRLEATAKGNHVSAETPVVAEIKPSGTIISPAQPLNFRSVFNTYANQTIKWTSSVNGKRYEISYRFNWDDVVGTDTIPRSFTRSIGTYVANGTGGGENMEAPFQGESFFETVGQLTGDNPAATSRIYRGVDIIWAVAGPDLHLYLQLNSPISGLVEDRPSYTNVANGFGLFTTRRFREIHKAYLGSTTVPELLEGQYTVGLGFVYVY